MATSKMTDLVLITWEKTHLGKTVQCGKIEIKNGRTLKKVMHISTLSQLSRELRRSGLLPTNLSIEKKKTIQFEIPSSQIPPEKIPLPIISAENFIRAMADNVDNKKISDSAFRDFFRNNLPLVIFDRNKKEDEK